MSTIFTQNYYLKAKDNLEKSANRNDGRPPSIEEIWREAMRIAWPEPDVDIDFYLAAESDLAEGQKLSEDGPFWIVIDGERYLVLFVNGVPVFLDEVLVDETVDDWLIEKLGEPEDLDYRGPKVP